MTILSPHIVPLVEDADPPRTISQPGDGHLTHTYAQQSILLHAGTSIRTLMSPIFIVKRCFDLTPDWKFERDQLETYIYPLLRHSDEALETTSVLSTVRC